MRLGDTIDDYCTKCKRGTDHAVVAMSGDEVLKVLCRTCNGEHAYRHNVNPKEELTKQKAFEKLLAAANEHLGVQPAAAAPVAAKKKRAK